MELVPQSLSTLIRRIEREPKSTPDACVFDLPRAKQWKGTPPKLDFSRRFHGERAANVVGPAAGPQTQLAQNLALSYLAGARIMELKTVQIMDELKIPRPCIDAANVGFNVEWSQELKIEQSRVEYAKAALLIAAMRRLGLPEGLAAGPDEDYLLDLSLGYDLKGISSERVTGFVRDMLDASRTIDMLLADVPPAYRDLSVPKRLISCVTLSTFHGCPANEIEKIAMYLMEELHLHVVVKLNPTLLGFEAVEHYVRDLLGYTELHTRRATFEKDLLWDDAIAMIARLRATAHRLGLTFGVKLTNTLVVDNHKTFFSDKEMYLSGQPLHVLATQLLAKIRRALPIVGPNGEPPVVYSFSAGIDQHNFPGAVAADLHPVTTCTDLLRPGGYGRLPKYLDNLAVAMRAVAAGDIDQWILRAHGRALPAMKSIAEMIAREAGRPDLAAALVGAAEDFAGGRGDTLAARIGDEKIASLARALWIHATGTENAEVLAKSALEDPRYRKEQNAKVPKKIGSMLELFDCVNCDKCVPVCPNDANFAYEVDPLALVAKTWRIENGAITEGPNAKVDINEHHQLATYVDFCNACGNCDVFCPEDGGPYVMKPHWFGSEKSFAEETRLDGFYLESADTIVGRIGGERMRLALDRAKKRALFETAAASVTVAIEEGELSLVSFVHHQPDRPCEVRGDRIIILTALLDGVQSTVNPVSAALAEVALRPPSLLARRAE